MGIIRLAGQYSPVRVEAAAERALVTGACRYQSVKSISEELARRGASRRAYAIVTTGAA